MVGSGYLPLINHSTYLLKRDKNKILRILRNSTCMWSEQSPFMINLTHSYQFDPLTTVRSLAGIEKLQ